MSRRASVPSKDGDNKSNGVHWREKCRELEDEVSSLKRRLEDLRKAKNTTVLKKEKQWVQVGEPSLGTRHSSAGGESGKVSDLQKQMEQLKLKHSKEIDDLKKKHSQEFAKKQGNNSQENDCGHEKIIQILEEKCDFLEKEKQEMMYLNDVINTDNTELREKYEQLMTELSMKEAQWCEKEEQLNMKLKLQWGEKYRQWMAQTEQKIAELQQVNEFLKGQLQSQAPKDD
ncbi:uncharacterized protein LOC144440264 [Glandiceps talaboti]